MRKSFFLVGAGLLLLGFVANGQDTTKRKTIDITSTFKPVLREAVKINFQASPPAPDATKPNLSYDIPSQFLLLNYQTGELRPVALQIDSLVSWENSNYIKVGAGSAYLPYIKTGFSFGDSKHAFFNIFADEFASKGSLPYQKANQTNVTVAGTVISKGNLEWTGRLGFKSDGNYLYGYQPDTLRFSKPQVQQNFQTFGGRISMRNLETTAYGLSYNPNLTVSVFNDNHSPKASETNSVLNLPLKKSIGDEFSFNLGLIANLTNYNLNGNAINNNLYLVPTSLSYLSQNLQISGGVTPSWDQHIFHLLPNLLAEITTNDKRFTLQLGWISHYDKGSYQRFESINPWLAQPDSLLNTRVQEVYGGIKGSLDNHFTYSAKVDFKQFWNVPLFVNDGIDGKTFVIRYEPSMDALELHGEIGYIQGEKFTASASVDFHNYTNLQHNAEAWGLLPFEFKANLRYEILNGLWLKADLWQFAGAENLGKNLEAYKGGNAFDLGAGVEFRIARQLNLWVQMNNILNDKYERWNQYQVYGFNLLGGIVFAFGQK